MIQALLAASGGYLLGSIPFGFLLSRMAGLGDIRSVGSGNIGATNVLRTGRKDIAALTLLLDAGKGTVAVLLAGRLAEEAYVPLIAGVAAVFGHCTSVWMGGRGGKGVATAFGVLLGWSWVAGLACGVLWLATAVATRRSSAAALVACVAAPVLVWARLGQEPGLAALFVALIVLGRHRENIRRLLAGTEPKIGAGR